ncbi:MAG: hypothetical protein ACRD04_01655 [Terriglobales bacterium]
MRVATPLRNLLRRQADRELAEEIGAFAEEMNQRTPHSVYAEQLREQVRAARPGAGLESWARSFPRLYPIPTTVALPQRMDP